MASRVSFETMHNILLLYHLKNAQHLNKYRH